MKTRVVNGVINAWGNTWRLVIQFLITATFDVHTYRNTLFTDTSKDTTDTPIKCAKTFYRIYTKSMQVIIKYYLGNNDNKMNIIPYTRCYQ